MSLREPSPAAVQEMSTASRVPTSPRGLETGNSIAGAKRKRSESKGETEHVHKTAKRESTTDAIATKVDFQDVYTVLQR